MKKPCYVVYSIDYTKSHEFYGFAILNCFETEEQALANLKYEKDVEENENGLETVFNGQVLRIFGEHIDTEITYDFMDYNTSFEPPIQYKPHKPHKPQ